VRKKHEQARDTPLAKRLRELRTTQNLEIDAAADEVGCTRGNLIAVEAGRRRPTSRMIAKYADAYGVPVDELSKLAAQHERTCGGQCDHDRAMRPGGAPDERFDDCANYDDCLAAAVKAYPVANSVHCPPNCTGRVTVPRYVRIGLSGGQNGDQRWDTFGEEERDES